MVELIEGEIDLDFTFKVDTQGEKIKKNGGAQKHLEKLSEAIGFFILSQNIQLKKSPIKGEPVKFR